MTKAPLGGGATGPNPTDRGKSGTKRSQLCEGHGLPLAIAVDGANIHDTRLVAPTLDAIVIARPHEMRNEIGRADGRVQQASGKKNGSRSAKNAAARATQSRSK